MKRALVFFAFALGCAGPERAARVTVPKPTAVVQTPHLGCQSGGCAYVPAPETHDIPKAKLDALLVQVNASPVGSDSLALDTLLFHDGEVRRRLAEPDAPALSPAWDAALKQELNKQWASFTLRVVDDQGRVRAELPETRMALGAKKHLEITETDLGTPMNANGTVVRVGQKHLWYRM